MLKRNIFFGAFVLLSCLVFYEWGSPQRWAGSFETKDGVKIITNPHQPVFGEVRFDLEEVWVLGKEKTVNDLFASVYDVKVDAQGNVYISDIKDKRVKKFSPEGKYLRDIGRFGQGPGEFQSARSLAVGDSSGDIYLADLMKVHRYNRDGMYQNDISLKGFFNNYFVDADGNFWARMAYFDNIGQGEAFDKISRNGELIKRILRYSPQDTRSAKPSSGQTVTVTGGIKHGYENEMIISWIDGRSFLWAISNEYTLNVVDSQGDLSFKIVKQEPPQPFSNKEKEIILRQFNDKVRKKIEFPKYRPFMKKVFADSEGRIYVQRIQSPLSDKEEYLYDIFNKSGYFLYESRFICEPVVIKNGYLYSVAREQETSYQLIKKYRIKNWDKIEKDVKK
jgi:hypothetical protein